MSFTRKLLLITAILVILYLTVKNSDMYEKIFADLAKGFSNMWAAMTKG